MRAAPTILLAAGLTALGQVLIQALGAVGPSLVRYPGPWRPTIGADTLWYLDAAAALPEVEPSMVTKVAYLVLLAVDTRLGLGGWGVVLLQTGLLVLAAWFLIESVRERHGLRAGVLAASALVLNPQVTQWTKVLLLEGVFVPIVVLLVLLLARSDVVRRLRPVALAIGASLVFVRPNGLGAFMGASWFLAAGRPKGRRLVPFLLGTLAVATVVVFSPLFATPGGDENSIAARTYGGLVIWIAPDDVTVAMPAPDDPNNLSNLAVLRYAAENPVAVGALAGRRVLWELVQVRAHYPPVVNLVVGIQTLVVLLLAAAGALRMRGEPLTRSILWVSLGLMLVIAGTWAVAEGRFGWSMMATWSPWIGVGGDGLLRGIDRRRGGSGAPRGSGVG